METQPDSATRTDPGTGVQDSGADTAEDRGPADADTGRCPNCGEPLTGRFCSACGQDQQADRSLKALLGAFIDDAFDVDSRVWRSLRLLVTRPGLLSVEHRAGRRARYLPPVRLYLVGSVLFFTAVTLAPAGVVRVGSTELTPADGGGEAGLLEEEAPARGDEVSEPQTDATREAESPGRLRAAFERASEEPERLEDTFLGSLAWVMFALVPIFALLLGILWRRSGFLYVHHLVFALHYHAFAFLTQAVGFVAAHAGGVLGVAALVTPHGANALYLYLAARRFYGEGRLYTLARIGVLGLAYLIVISAGMLATLWVLVLVVWGGA